MWITPIMAPKRKRTLNEEGRVFNEGWGMQYFFVPNKDKICYLLCDATISCMKKYNAKLHYETHEKHKHFQLEGEERKIAFERLKNQIERQQQMFKKISCQKNDAIEATYRVALLLGKRGKPFSDVDISVNLSTRHRQFRELLINDDETDIIDMPFYCQVRWLSRGNILSKTSKLRQQIVSFYEKQKKHCYLSDFDFIKNPAFLCDLMSKQNELNIFLQGKSKCIYDMRSKIAFRKI